MKWNIPRAKCQRPVLSDPPWLEDVKLTPELLYKYQLETKELVDVLRHDMDKLKSVRQVGAEAGLGADAGIGAEAQARKNDGTTAGDDVAGDSARMSAEVIIDAGAGVIARPFVRANTDADVSVSAVGGVGEMSLSLMWLRPVLVVQTQTSAIPARWLRIMDELFSNDMK